MIAKLRISNYAIIDHLDVTFNPGLNVITGETGAGKSIILGALGLIMGERADTKALYSASEKCIIEGEFSGLPKGVNALLDNYDLDQLGDTLLVRREISTSGRSRAFVNDTPVNLQQLESITDKLVDLHQQFATLELRKSSYQIDVLDTISDALSDRAIYQEKFEAFRRTRKSLDALIEAEKQSRQELDYLEFQVEEFSSVDPNPSTDGDIESEVETLENAEGIRQQLQINYHHLKGNDSSIADRLQELYNDTAKLATYHKDSADVAERLNGLIAELDDLAETCNDLADNLEVDEALIQEKRQRLDQINNLKLKHSVQTIEELDEVRQSFEERLASIGSLQKEISEQEKALKELEKEAKDLAAGLTKKRQKGKSKLEKGVEAVLASLNMGKAKVEVRIESRNDVDINGLDDVEIRFSANVGNETGKIKDVASGGELSRLALAIKSQMASKAQLPTMIFDEIDAGVSGDVALKMGNILHGMAENHQMIVITHSAQIAAQGKNHFFVYKEERNGRTNTQVQLLDDGERTEKIAIMLSSDPPSKAAIENARELLSLS